MKTESVLITGGAGFIGSHLAERLLSMKYRVIVLDNLSRGIPDNIRACYNYAPNFYFAKGSVLDRNLVDTLMSKVDMVFHLAAQVHWEESINEPVESFEVNAIGTQNILEAMRRNIARRNPIKLMLHASSSEVYGTADYVPMDEKHPFNPQSPYAAGKAAADRLCSAYYHVYKVPVIILRQFNTYGSRQRFGGYSAVIPKFISQVLSNMPPTIYGSGKQTKDFHYIDDLINAYVLILERFVELDLFGEAINFGTGIETTINKLADIILKTASKSTGQDLIRKLGVIHLPKRPGEVMRFSANTTLARKKLGFEPKIKLEDGLTRYLDWFIKEHYIVPENIRAN